MKAYIKLLPFVAIGLAIVAVVVVWIFYMQRGAHIELVGSIQKVRTWPLDDKSSAAFIDFRFRNPSDYKFIVRKVDVTAVDAGGNILDGMVMAESDATKIFEYFPKLGQKFNPTLLIRTTVMPKQSMDRMVAARFEVPEKVLQIRKNLTIRIEEIDGPVAEIQERPQK